MTNWGNNYCLGAEELLHNYEHLTPGLECSDQPKKLGYQPNSLQSAHFGPAITKRKIFFLLAVVNKWIHFSKQAIIECLNVQTIIARHDFVVFIGLILKGSKPMVFYKRRLVMHFVNHFNQQQYHCNTSMNEAYEFSHTERLHNGQLINLHWNFNRRRNISRMDRWRNSVMIY